MGDQDEEWQHKGSALSDKTARAEFGDPGAIGVCDHWPIALTAKGTRTVGAGVGEKDPESPDQLPGKADKPVGGRRLQWIALVLGIAASLATVIGLFISQSGSNAAQQNAATTDAAQVRTCMADHHLSQPEPPIPDPAPSQFVVRSCAWPPAPGAAQDGFTAIDVSTVAGPGQDEASDATEIDRITSPCTDIQLVYTNGSQGKSNFPRFTVAVPTVTSMDTAPKPWTGLTDSLPFDPGPNEVDYVRNLDQTLSAASCAS